MNACMGIRSVCPLVRSPYTLYMYVYMYMRKIEEDNIENAHTIQRNTKISLYTIYNEHVYTWKLWIYIIIL